MPASPPGEPLCLREWEALGIDVSALLGMRMARDEATGILHDSSCSTAHAVTGPFASALSTVDSPLCRRCWQRTTSAAGLELLVLVDQVKEASDTHLAAREQDLAGDGFWLLVSALERLPTDEPAVSVWARRLRSGMVADLDAAFAPDRPTARAAALVDFSFSRPLSGRRGLVVTSPWVVERIFGQLNPSLQRLVMLSWAPLSPFPGFVLECPAEVAEHVGSSLRRASSRVLRERIGWVSLSSADTPAVLEVAAGLYDPGSDLYQDVGRVFETARTV